MPIPVTPQKALAGAEAAAESRTETIGRYAVDRQVAGALRKAAGATGVGFGVLAAKAAMESGFKPAAQASTSSARGLFQFIDRTWLATVEKHGADHGLATEAAAITRGAGGRLSVSDPTMRARILALRDDPDVSARMGAEHLKDISESLAPVLGRKPDAAELYLGHFLGVGGASEVLRKVAADPDMAARQVLPEAARANPRIFNGADGAPLSVKQLVERIRGKVDQVYAELGLTTPSGPLDMTQTELASAKPGEAVPSSEAGWWGSGSPTRVAHLQEKALVSTLVEVFNRMGKSASFRGRQGEPQDLPASVLEALRETQAAPGQADARRAYGA
jgi:hypothetical protein